MRYIISTVVPGAKPNIKFLNSIKCFMHCNSESQLLLLSSTKVYKDDILNPYFNDMDIINEDYKINSNIHISSMPINPEAIDPIAGLGRYTQLEGSVILASPKQRMKSIASPKSPLPRIVMTTGAVTNPYYRPSKRGIMAGKDHVCGAIILEVENNEVYHFRQIQESSDGSFVDLGMRYFPNNQIKRENAEALIPGDWHVGFTEQSVREVILDVMKELKPKYLVLHDFFDGLSVNHHIERNKLERGVMGQLNDLSLELERASNELKFLESRANNIIIVKSNHDEFLDKWLEEGKYTDDRQNHVIGLELALAKAKGYDPLEYGFNKFNSFKKTRFLKEDESFKLTHRKIECGVHGHRGPNGSRGSASNMEQSYGNIIMGHTHTPEILRGCYVVGTSSLLSLNYNVGASSWLHTFCLLYKDGSRQLINVIKGKWKL